jgi:hypothetical protein
MTRPQRVQRRRVKGYRLPEGAVYVGRPTNWGNPYHVERKGSRWVTRAGDSIIGSFEDVRSARRWAAEAYRAWWGKRTVSVEEIRTELAGRDLACWCPLVDANGTPVPCHADVLLSLANGGEA